jgi:hypothetical protein
MFSGTPKGCDITAKRFHPEVQGRAAPHPEGAQPMWHPFGVRDFVAHVPRVRCATLGFGV